MKSMFSDKSKIFVLAFLAILIVVLARIRFELWIAVAMASFTALIPVYQKVSEVMRKNRKKKERRRKLKDIVSAASENLHQLKLMPAEEKDKEELIERLDNESITKKKVRYSLRWLIGLSKRQMKQKKE